MVSNYRWLTKAEAKAKFPKSEAARDSVMESGGTSPYLSADEWAKRLLDLASEPSCDRVRARRYREAVAAMRVKP